MTRDEAIKLLKLIKSTVYLGNHKFFDALDFAISYLRQPEHRWIPCSIKQPQKGLMLVTFNDGDIALLKQPTAYRRSDIVAWMPVEPYREEGEE